MNHSFWKRKIGHLLVHKTLHHGLCWDDECLCSVFCSASTFWCLYSQKQTKAGEKRPFEITLLSDYAGVRGMTEQEWGRDIEIQRDCPCNYPCFYACLPLYSLSPENQLTEQVILRELDWLAHFLSFWATIAYHISLACKLQGEKKTV